jgi:hypothetical protein
MTPSEIFPAVIPAKAGIHFALGRKSKWVPAFAGTTRYAGLETSRNFFLESTFKEEFKRLSKARTSLRNRSALARDIEFKI